MGAKRLRCLPGRIDMSRAVGVKRRGRSQNHEMHDCVRGEHAGDDIDARLPQFRVSRPFSLCEVAALCALFLDLLRRLPEKQVRRNRRPEDADQHGQRLARPG
jgi:hypothetical protein